MLDLLFSIDIEWRRVFLPTMSLAEILVRGMVMYLVVFLLLRIAHRRQSGGLSVTDVLVVVLIADAAGPALSGKGNSIADSTLLVATIIGCSHLLNWLVFRYPLVDRIVHPVPVELVRDGKLVHRAMRRQLVSEPELMQQLRGQGIDSLDDTRHVYMEADGRISVITLTDEDRAAGGEADAPGSPGSTLPASREARG